MEFCNLAATPRFDLDMMSAKYFELSDLDNTSLHALLTGLSLELRRREERRCKEELIVAERKAEKLRLDALPAKYMHPSNRALAWSGEGRQPAWIDMWIAQGGTLYALQIAAEKMAMRQIPAGFQLPTQDRS